MRRRPLILLALLLVALPAAGQEGGTHKAPTRLWAEPPGYLLLPLGGDRAHFRYIPGSLDRAANLQFRLEAMARALERWTGHPLDYVVYVIGRREWEEARIGVDYGVPVRVGQRGMAVPARGDDGTVGLWSEVLDGFLPTVVGTPVMGTARELASLVMADVLVSFMAGEILVDGAGLATNEPWARGVTAHLAALTVATRKGTDRLEDLATVYLRLLERHPPKTFSVRDYNDDLSLEDWLWFQAQFHFGARAIYDKEGKDSLKKLKKLKKRGNGVIDANDLRRKYKGLDEWLTTNFSAVSFQR